MLLRSLVVVFLLCASAWSQTAGLASVRVYKYGGTKYEHVNNDNIPEGKGSGWIITPTQVITAYHVVHNNRGGDKPIMVRFVDGTRSWATVEAVDMKHDIALLWINPHETIEPVTVGSTPYKGQEVTIHGFGHDYEYKTHTGRVLCDMGSVGRDYDAMIGMSKCVEDGPWTAVSTTVIPGDSGGAVTHNGEVVGSVLSITYNTSIFCKIETIMEAFKSKIIKPSLRIK